MSTVAVVGLGQMGAGIAASLARVGRTVMGVDPGGKREIPGVTQVPFGKALEEAEVLFLSLPGSEQVREVLTGADGLLDAKVPARLVIDTSTSDPAMTRQLAARLRDVGHALVDAPVSGGPGGARDGALTVFLGCREGLLARVCHELEPLAEQVNHVGDVGAGNIAKLVNNLLCGIHLTAARETWRIAEASGIEPARLIDAVNNASGRSAITEVNIPRWILTGAFDSGFTVRLMARDVALATHVASTSGAEVPFADAALQEWAGLLEAAGPDADFNRMVTT